MKQLLHATLILFCFWMMEAGGLAQTFITTVAGGGTAGITLNMPGGVVTDASGNLLVADTYNHRILRVAPSGLVQVVAGTGTDGFSGDGGPASAARLSFPTGVVEDAGGNIFILDSCNGRIRRITADGRIDTVGMFGFYCGYWNGDSWGSLTLDSSGNLLTGDQSRVLRFSPNGGITTVAGDGGFGFGGDGGPALSAQFSWPSGIALDKEGNFYFADWGNSRVRKVTAAGIVSTVAGNGLAGFSGDGGPASSAQLNFPVGVAIDGAGNLLIADSGNYRIRKVSPAGIISTVAGNGTQGFSGDGGLATAASLGWTAAITLDGEGNLFIADSIHNRIRRVFTVDAPPVLHTALPDLATPGTTVSITLSGENFLNPLAVAAGDGITVDSVEATSDSTATLRLTVASVSPLGSFPLTVSTALGSSNAIPFAVVAPFPDLDASISQTRDFAVGFNGEYVVGIRNAGTVASTGPTAFTVTLPDGFSYVSQTGPDWSCSAAGQAIECSNPQHLEAGDSTSLNLTVSIGPGAANGAPATVSVNSEGDLLSHNNSATNQSVIAQPPAPYITVTPLFAEPRQTMVSVRIPAAFPYDVSGTLTATFTPDAVNPADDPAIQFAVGGRQLTFVIPAGTFQAASILDGVVSPGPFPFQSGTVAGTIEFDGVLQTEAFNSRFSANLRVLRQAPEIHEIRTSADRGIAASITLSSTPREVTELVLSFNGATRVRLSCGPVAGCAASGSTLTLDVRSLFDAWYSADRVFGSLVTLRVPLSIEGTLNGTVDVYLRNAHGTSNAMRFTVP